MDMAEKSNIENTLEMDLAGEAVKYPKNRLEGRETTVDQIDSIRNGTLRLVSKAGRELEAEFSGADFSNGEKTQMVKLRDVKGSAVYEMDDMQVKGSVREELEKVLGGEIDKAWHLKAA